MEEEKVTVRLVNGLTGEVLCEGSFNKTTASKRKQLWLVVAESCGLQYVARDLLVPGGEDVLDLCKRLEEVPLEVAADGGKLLQLQVSHSTIVSPAMTCTNPLLVRP